MSLFGTIQQSSGALQAAQIGLQVVGNNIANANTDGYIRQKLEQTPGTAVRTGNLIQGHGVRPTGITQVVDKALLERLYQAGTSLAGGETLDKAYTQLEELTSDLDNNGLNQQLTKFNNALHELSTQPGDSAMREFVVLTGDTLATNLQRTRAQVVEGQREWDNKLEEMSAQINRLTKRIAEHNVAISTIEGGGLIGSDATGLRDQRYQDLEELAKYVDIKVQERDNGNVAVFVGGDYLISEGNRREVYTAHSDSDGGREIRIVETDSPLQATAGKLPATLQARDEIFGKHLQQLDQLASGLIRSVNEVHSQGQGRQGLQQLTSEVETEPGVPLSEAGLAWTPRNGTFDMNVVDLEGEVVSSHRIPVRMLGQVGDSTVASIAADIDAISGVRASVNSDGQLKIQSESPTNRFTFGEDTSGFLAAAGINTFFVGNDASNIGVHGELKQNSDLLSISRGGIGADTEVLTEMIDLVDRPADHLDGRSVRDIYEQTVAGLGQKISLQRSATEGLRNFHGTLSSQHLAISGVNIDEESIRMLSYQRAFQASSRVISTASEMLELLVSL